MIREEKDKHVLLSAVIGELLCPMLALVWAPQDFARFRAAVNALWGDGDGSAMNVPSDDGAPWVFLRRSTDGSLGLDATQQEALQAFFSKHNSPVPSDTFLQWVADAAQLMTKHEGDVRLAESLRRVYRLGEAPPSWW